MRVYVENHHTRDATAFAAAIAAQGHEPHIHTDATDYYRLTGHRRWRGNFQNYIGILREARKDRLAEDWVIVLQDDVSLPDGLFDRMAHILRDAPGPLVAFYVPTNGLFQKAQASGAHVVETYRSFWIQAMAFARPSLEQFYDWGMTHIQAAWDQDGDGGSDDDFLSLMCSHERIVVRVVLPSLVQHIGASTSLFKTGAQVGKFPRTSDCYAPTFDPTTVDWKAAFEAPFIDRGRYGKSDPRYARTKGLV